MNPIVSVERQPRAEIAKAQAKRDRADWPRCVFVRSSGRPSITSSGFGSRTRSDRPSIAVPRTDKIPEPAGDVPSPQKTCRTENVRLNTAPSGAIPWHDRDIARQNRYPGQPGPPFSHVTSVAPVPCGEIRANMNAAESRTPTTRRTCAHVSSRRVAQRETQDINETHLSGCQRNSCLRRHGLPLHAS